MELGIIVTSYKSPARFMASSFPMRVRKPSVPSSIYNVGIPRTQIAHTAGNGAGPGRGLRTAFLCRSLNVLEMMPYMELHGYRNPFY